MADLRRRKIILFFDSRGRNLEFILKSLNKSDKIIEPWMFEGATIEDLAHEAEYYAQNAPFDVIYIAGGICNITTKNKQTKKVSFEWTDSTKLASHLVQSMERAEKFLQISKPATKFTFCPLLGADLEKVLKRPAEKEQVILDEAVWIFNEEVFQKNKMTETYAPNFADPVYRKIRGIKRTFFHHLHNDGIHLSDNLQLTWAKKIMKLANIY